MAIESESEIAIDLKGVIASLNQLAEYDYVSLGESRDEIRANFEITLGLCKSPAIGPTGPTGHVSFSFARRPAEGHWASYRSPPITTPEEGQKWNLSLTNAFVKETKGLDRKLQGRILEALLELINAPMTPKGDTCKPLSGKLSGLWRLRIGDTRLIYKPDAAKRTVYCLTFNSRGSVYG